MAISLMRDANAHDIKDSMRPDFAHAANATTGASITELDISGMNIAANQNEQGLILIRVTCVTNPCYFSLGAAGTPPGSNAAMTIIPINGAYYFKAKASDVSAYHQQIVGAGILSVAAMT